MLRIRNLSVLLAVALMSLATYSQRETQPDTIPSNDSGELVSAITDHLANDARASGARLFVIFHRGTNDSNRYITLNRMMMLKAYFSATQKRFGELEPVFAIGDDVKGEGRIDYYLGSSLRLVVFAKRNAIPNFTCCPEYVPPKKSLKKARRIRK
jgi:hypothetical protein